MTQRKGKIKGLSQEEVRERRRAGLTNAAVAAPSKTVKEIVLSNVFTYFNGVFLVIAILLILVGSYRDLTFLPVIICNSLIGILQELQAKAVLDKIAVLHAPQARVIREGIQKAIPTEKLVLDDVILLKAGDQIPADAIIVSGEIAVNESLLTGESDEIIKEVDDELMSGSFVVYGECYAKLTRVGAESYASQLTLKAKAIKTKEQSEIIRSLNAFVKLAGIAIIPIGIVLFAQQYFFKHASGQLAVQSMVAAIIGMIPEGLFLLASITLALSAMRLALSKVMLHDMKSIETLARVDTLCVDKTGTITDDKMEVKGTVWLGADEKREKLLPLMLGEVVSKLPAENATMAALKRKFKRSSAFHEDEYAGYVGSIGFSSKYKYSGVQFEKTAFLIGAPEFVMRDQFKSIKKKVEEFSKKGYRILVFGKYNGRLMKNSGDISEKELTEKVTPLGLVILENNIRETAPATFKYFVEQGVDVKIISGDNPVTVSEVAKRAGIPGAEKYVDITKLGSGVNFKKGVLNNTVLGRVTPNQKRRIIRILKEEGRTVAMVGDGVNDVLALKDADCSVAMASGAQAAVQVSQMVLLESDFSKMPMIVDEGRRVVNNLQRSGSLFLVKNIFSLITALLSIFLAITYPLNPTQVSLVTMFTIGMPSFLLAQIPNHDLIKGNFMRNVIFKAAPAAITNVVLIMLTTGIGNFLGLGRSMVSTLCAFVWAVVGFVFMIRLCKPLDKTKGGIIGLCAFGMIFCSVFFRDLFALNQDISFVGWLIFIAMATLVYPVMNLSEKFFTWLNDVWFEKYVQKYAEKIPDFVESVEDKVHAWLKKTFVKNKTTEADSSIRKVAEDEDVDKKSNDSKNIDGLETKETKRSKSKPVEEMKAEEARPESVEGETKSEEAEKPVAEEVDRGMAESGSDSKSDPDSKNEKKNDDEIDEDFGDLGVIKDE